MFHAMVTIILINYPHIRNIPYTESSIFSLFTLLGVTQT